MPRLKKGSLRFTPRPLKRTPREPRAIPPAAPTPTAPSSLPTDAAVVVAVDDGDRENNQQQNLQNGTPEEVSRMDDPEAALATPTLSLPMIYCVVCYNDFTPYSLNCLSWETAVTKDFYVALDIPSEEQQDEESVISLPFCPECHSKVAVMFSVHQQLQSILQNFNSIRNDLAFTVVETIEKNCKKGPLDLIRRQIFERWTKLHAEAKEAKTCDAYDEQMTRKYLDPKLTVADEWPLDSKSMDIRNFTKSLSKIMSDKQNADISHSDVTEKYTNTSPQAPQISVPPAEVNTKIIATQKKASAEFGGMPKLEPMAKIPIGSPKKLPTTGFFTSTSKFSSVNNTKSNSLTVMQMQIKKKKMASAKVLQAKLVEKNQPNGHNMNPHYDKVKRKPPKELADGRWKCGYCPITYADLIRVNQHESRCHPNTRPLLCHLCTKGFFTAVNLRRHLKVTHEQKLIAGTGTTGFTKCPYCVKCFRKQHSFELHIRTIHKGKRIPKFEDDDDKKVKAVVEGENKFMERKPGRPRKSILPVTKTPALLGAIKVKIPMTSPPSPEITDFPPTIHIRPATNGKPRTEPPKSGRKVSIIDKRNSNSTSINGSVNGQGNAGNRKSGSTANINSKSKTNGASSNLIIASTEIENDDPKGDQKDSLKLKRPPTESAVAAATKQNVWKRQKLGTGNLTCPICGRKFLKHQGLNGHLGSHKNRKSELQQKNATGLRQSSSNEKNEELSTDSGTLAVPVSNT